jgi:SAM-dependent methyltransferase
MSSKKNKQMENFDTVTEYLLSFQPKIQKIFDAGFGDCKWIAWTRKHNIGFEGIEIDPKLVQKGREEYPEHAEDLYEGDMTDGALKQFADKSADVVLVIEVIEHIRHPDLVRDLLKECCRIAKKKVIITTPNCGDEHLLRKHGLTYLHYTHVATEGMKFTVDRAHRHWIRFTKENLTELLSKNFTNFKVMEKRPIQILKVLCYDKLWAEINVEEEDDG